jgi:8-oxo-dGTP pyrophosphatase MutT (NUDIX family)
MSRRTGAMNELAEHMTRVARASAARAPRPKDAATLILIDRSAAPAKVLLGKRHHGHVFMPGKFVFPGGRVERHDRAVPVVGALDAHIEAKLMRLVPRPSPAKARGYAVAAVREVFEETGLLLGRKIDGAPRAAKADGPADPFAAAGVCPDLSQLHLIARAVTPPGRPRRFDTRFFAADAALIAHRVEDVVGPESELVELTWLPIKDARELDIPPVTKRVLSDLEARVAAGFGHDLPVPFYRLLHNRFTCVML